MPGANFGSSPSLKQLVYDNLKERIIQGELKPGTRLREEDLSTDMNISRAPIREALNMLERDGFTTIVPRKGAMVAEIMKEDILYIWEMRVLLEPYAARVSAGKIPEKRLERVREELVRVLDDPDNMNLYMKTDLEVHEMLVDYLDNRFLRSTLQGLKEHSLRLRWAAEYDNEETQASIVAEATKEHIEITDAFLAGDKDLVFRVVKRHVENSAERLLGANYVNYQK